MKDKVKNVGGKIKNGAKKVKDKVSINDKRDSVKPNVVSRMLFYSIYNFILLVVFFIFLAFSVYACFKELRYFGFGAGLKTIIVYAIGLFIIYLILNWIYKCVIKSMLCITDKEVYGELYVPFYRYETSIPLNKITGVTTMNFLWIFRTVIIHQYGKMPFVWATWNNKEFKDELVKLTTGENKKVDSQEGHDALIPKTWKKGVKIVGIIILAIFILALIMRAFDSAAYNSKVKGLVGTYKDSNDASIVLNKDNTCEIKEFLNSMYTMDDCTWEVVKEINPYTTASNDPIVKVTYKYYYEYTSLYSGDTTRHDYESNLKLYYYKGDLKTDYDTLYEKQ